MYPNRVLAESSSWVYFERDKKTFRPFKKEVQTRSPTAHHRMRQGSREGEVAKILTKTNEFLLFWKMADGNALKTNVFSVFLSHKLKKH